MSQYTFTVLGCRGSFPIAGSAFAEFGGATSCYVLRLEEYAVVIDCGTGFYGAASALAGCTKVDILLTHLHYDHTLGFLYPAGIPANAKTRIFVYTTDGKEPRNPLSYIQSPYWPYIPQIGEACAAHSGVPLLLHNRVTAHVFPANHPNDAAILRLDTDVGSFCVICDWEHGEQSVPRDITNGCSFILYDGTFTDGEYVNCIGWGHSTWREGIKLARERGIPRLLISHHAPEHTDAMLREMEQEAQRELPTVRFVRTGDQYDIGGELLRGVYECLRIVRP